MIGSAPNPIWQAFQSDSLPSAGSWPCVGSILTFQMKCELDWKKKKRIKWFDDGDRGRILYSVNPQTRTGMVNGGNVSVGKHGDTLSEGKLRYLVSSP